MAGPFEGTLMLADWWASLSLGQDCLDPLSGLIKLADWMARVSLEQDWLDPLNVL